MRWAQALIGSTGPVMNPMYFNYGLEKEAMVGTKALNKAMLHLTKLLSLWCVWGVRSGLRVLYGLVIGLAALPANWLGRAVLARMSVQQFRQLVFTFVAFSGIWMIWQQRSWFLIWGGNL
jgi:uncharacterized membrane protein YfcA